MPAKLKISPNQVDIWQLHLPLEKRLLQELHATLSDAELQRAEKLVTTQLKDKFIAARGVLRNVLARYTQQNPKDLVLSYTQYGKPFLANSDLNFNLAHSGNKVVLAITSKRAVGMDIEEIKPQTKCLAIAKRFFTMSEYNKLTSLPLEQQGLAFFRCWTRKEAFIKAIGQGLHYALNEFEVSLLPDEEPQLIKVRDKPNYQQSTFKLTEIFVDQHYVACLASASDMTQINYFTWETIN